MICSICPRHCNIDRAKNAGFCQSPAEFKVARAALHYWEEPLISGKKGSGAVFFSGCNLRCVYCQNYEISRDNKGVTVTDEKLVDIFESLIRQGAQNINLVNPTHYALRIADLLSHWKCPVPVVYNSSGYEEVSTLKRLEGLVDIYLPDLKYIRSDKAMRYSSAPDYFEKASAALLEMRRQVKDNISNEIMQSGLIVRHLVLPLNTNSSLKIIDWFADNLPNTYLSLMSQYLPCGDLSKTPEIDRRITRREYEKVLNYAGEKGLEKVFIQQLSAADKKYVPSFDFTGVI